MPEILPFKGLIYNQSKIDIQDVVAPPYDVISPEQQERLYARSPSNVVRLILGREEDRYASAARHLDDWIERSILVRDSVPTIYLLNQAFTGLDGTLHTRQGLIALCHLEDFEKKVVLPHEKTLSKPREDRLKLFKATNANLSQIFSLYSDPEKFVDRLINGTAKTESLFEVGFEDVQNRLWRISDENVIRKIQDFMKGKQVLIADGHHRYETALTYRNLMKEKNPKHTGNELYNYVMMFFTNIEDEGLVVYPTHRIVHSLPLFEVSDLLKKLQEYFITREFQDHQTLLKGLESSPVQSLGLVTKEESCCYLLTLKPSVSLDTVITDALPKEVKELDVTLLHNLILKDLLGISVQAQEEKLNLDYVKDARQAFDAVRKGTAQLAFLMNPTRIDQVRNVAKAGHTMPQKSTYFYPKLLSGLVLNRMDT